jgi:hypothetical protein
MTRYSSNEIYRQKIKFANLSANLINLKQEFTMNQAYRDAITQMEEMKVQQEYILGWQGGFLGHPQREEQRLTEAYEAGYEDGSAKSSDNFSNWTES